MTVNVTWGERRITSTESARVYFQGVTPTGQSMGMKDYAAYMKMVWYDKTVDDYLTATREMAAAYEVLKPRSCIMKMMIRHSVFGRIATTGDIYIKLDEDCEEIKIEGPGGFGSFQGRGKIIAEKSRIPSTVTVTVKAPAKTAEGTTDMGIVY